VSDLISTPPAPASPLGSKVEADGWFPAIDCNDLRDALRLADTNVTQARLVAAIKGAMLHAFRQLAAWRTAHAAAGVADLASVPDDIAIDGEPRTVELWTRIVRYYTAAELADGHRDIVAADQQSQRSEEKRLSADDYRRMAHHAVADLTSIGADTPVQRNHVELL
jgi:hypothetical protein